MSDFFVSYTASDRDWATWIAWTLEEAGYSTVLQDWDFRPGTNFVLAMQAATTASKQTIAVLSSDYLAAVFTQPEWAAAFAIDPSGTSRRLLPVRIAPVELSGLLKTIVYLDLVGCGDSEARGRLLAGVKEGRTKPDTRPPFPGARTVPARPRFPGSGASSAQAAPNDTAAPAHSTSMRGDPPREGGTGSTPYVATADERSRSDDTALTTSVRILSIRNVLALTLGTGLLTGLLLLWGREPESVACARRKANAMTGTTAGPEVKFRLEDPQIKNVNGDTSRLRSLTTTRLFDGFSKAHVVPIDRELVAAVMRSCNVTEFEASQPFGVRLLLRASLEVGTPNLLMSIDGTDLGHGGILVNASDAQPTTGSDLDDGVRILANRVALHLMDNAGIPVSELVRKELETDLPQHARSEPLMPSSEMPPPSWSPIGRMLPMDGPGRHSRTRKTGLLRRRRGRPSMRCSIATLTRSRQRIGPRSNTRRG